MQRNRVYPENRVYQKIIKGNTITEGMEVEGN